jgi:hypothetical protein
MASQLQPACARPVQAPAIPASAQHATPVQLPLLHVLVAATQLARTALCSCAWARRVWWVLLQLLLVRAVGALHHCALPAMSGGYHVYAQHCACLV